MAANRAALSALTAQSNAMVLVTVRTLAAAHEALRQDRPLAVA